MGNPAVWTEREAGLPWTECCHSAVLDVLLYGGLPSAKFPAGMYSNNERHGLATQDGLADHTGANFVAVGNAVKARYGVTLHAESWSSSQLESALSVAGKAYAVAGSEARHPAGAALWDPYFKGAHAVCMVPLGTTKVLWLDPLAPDRYAGDQVAVSEAVAWAAALHATHDPRWLAAGEVGQGDDMYFSGADFEGVTNRRYLTEAGAQFRSEPKTSAGILATFGAGTGVVPHALVDGDAVGGSTKWYLAWMYAQSAYRLGALHESVLNDDGPVEDCPTDPADAAAADAVRTRASWRWTRRPPTIPRATPRMRSGTRAPPPSMPRRTSMWSPSGRRPRLPGGHGRSGMRTPPRSCRPSGSAGSS